MSFDSLLIHACDIYALTQGAQDSYGTPAVTWTSTYTSQPCRMYPTAVREVKVGAKVVISDKALFLDEDVTIDEQDQIRNITLRADGTVIDASTFEVLSVKHRSDGTNQHHKELLLQKVT